MDLGLSNVTDYIHLIIFDPFAVSVVMEKKLLKEAVRLTVKKQKGKQTVNVLFLGLRLTSVPLLVTFHIQHFFLFSSKIILCGRRI